MKNFILTRQWSRKVTFFVLSVACLTISIAMQGCSKDSSESRKSIFIVDSNTTLTNAIPEAGTSECMVAKEEGTNNVYYFTLNQIKGFEYQKGYSYRIKVQIDPVNEVLIDASQLSYKLIEVLSKTRVNPSN